MKYEQSESPLVDWVNLRIWSTVLYSNPPANNVDQDASVEALLEPH